jgi:hypothetical protein
MEKIKIFLHQLPKVDKTLSENEKTIILAMRSFLPSSFDPEIDVVYAGTEECCFEVARLLGINIDTAHEDFSSGKNAEFELLKMLSFAIVITSPRFMQSLGEEKAQPGSIWEATHDGKKIINLERICSIS